MADGSILKSMRTAVSEDGQIVRLDFIRLDGTAASISIPTMHAANVATAVEGAIGTAWEKAREHLKGADPRSIFPIAAKKVSHFGGATAVDGTPVLSIVLDTGLRLDLGLDENAIPALVEWLEQFEVDRRGLGPTKN